MSLHLGWGRSVLQFISELKENPQMSAPSAKKTVNHYSYRLTDTIGDGFSSQVFKGIDQKQKILVAIKVVSKLAHNAKEQVELAKTEIRALGILKGRANILELKESLQTRNSMYIITELCPRGTLRDELSVHRRLKEERAIQIISQLINGYRSIHAEGLVHRDIKPDNLFLSFDDELKIGDFGFAIDVQRCSQALRQNLGSPLFMSPEALTRNVYSFKSDIWAIGVTFYEMLVGRVPWRSKTEKELLQELQSFSIEALLPKGVSNVCETFLRRTLAKDVDLRMDAEQLFGFDFQQQKQKRAAVRKGQKSESTDENSKQNLEKIGEIDAQTPKMTSSLTRQQSTVLPEKSKKLNRKYSFIKQKDEMPNCLQVEQQVPMLRNRSQTVKQTKLSLKMQKQILLQIQSQINYFRFIFKVFKKTNQMLKTADQNFQKLKNNLLYLSHAKIQEIKILKYLKFHNDIKTSFMISPEYGNVLDVLNQYSQKYRKQQQKTSISPECEGEKEFIERLTYTIKVLHQNIAKIQTNAEEFQRKKNLVFIVESLLELSRLYVMQRQHDWSSFHKQSNILKALQKAPAEMDVLSHWQKVKAEMKDVISI